MFALRVVTLAALFGATQAALATDLIFSEILPNPVSPVSDQDGEYIKGMWSGVVGQSRWLASISIAHSFLLLMTLQTLQSVQSHSCIC